MLGEVLWAVSAVGRGYCCVATIGHRYFWV